MLHKNQVLIFTNIQSSEAAQPTPNRRCWLSVCWEKFAHRIHCRRTSHTLFLAVLLLTSSECTKITLPRAEGSCSGSATFPAFTWLPHLHLSRCPVECRLSCSISPWSCEVFLCLERHRTEIRFGPFITDKSDVEDRIRRAQLAILNPSKEPSGFLGPLGRIDRGIKNEMSFSSDLVSVRISGREIDDLSFVDLPGLNPTYPFPLSRAESLTGIITSVREGGRESDVEDVKNLVHNVIKRSSCLILLAISCDSKFILARLLYCSAILMVAQQRVSRTKERVG